MSDQQDFKTALYRVSSISILPTRNPQVPQYQIGLMACEPRQTHTIVSTVNKWNACLCQRAKDLNVPALVTWQKTRFGHNLQRVIFLDARPVLDRLMPHDGNFGTSGWVSCDAPNCVNLERGISRWEPNYVDPQTNQHWHEECVAAARGLDGGSASGEAVATLCNHVEPLTGDAVSAVPISESR